MSSQRNPERGALIHCTGLNQGWRRILAAFFIISTIGVPGVMLASYLQLTLIAESLEFKSGCLALVLISAFMFSVTFFMMVGAVLHPKITIYERGLTTNVFPIFRDKEGDFVPFADMESFSVSRNRLTCAIMLHNKDIHLWWHSHFPEDILPIAEALRKNGIPETD